MLKTGNELELFIPMEIIGNLYLVLNFANFYFGRSDPVFIKSWKDHPVHTHSLGWYVPAIMNL